MPNHVINRVTISANGNKQKLAECAKQIIRTNKDENGQEQEVFSFNHIIPMAESLNITEGSETEMGMEYLEASEERQKEIREKSWYANNKSRFDEMLELGRKALENIKKYGYPTWYKWSIANWGTKWDAYEVGFDVSEDVVEITFQTAWSTPEKVIAKLSEQYPELRIEVQYADEDFGSNCGTYTYVNGEVVEEFGGDEDFALTLWGYDPDEYRAEMEEDNN